MKFEPGGPAGGPALLIMMMSGSGIFLQTGVLDLDGGKAFGLAILVIKIVLCLFSHGIYGADGKIIRREL